MRTYVGMPVVVHHPYPQQCRRTWRERLLTRPWRPWRQWKTVMVPSLPTPSTCFVLHGKLHCTPEVYQMLRADNQLNAQGNHLSVLASR